MTRRTAAMCMLGSAWGTSAGQKRIEVRGIYFEPEAVLGPGHPAGGLRRECAVCGRRVDNRRADGAGRGGRRARVRRISDPERQGLRRKAPGSLARGRTRREVARGDVVPRRLPHRTRLPRMAHEAARRRCSTALPWPACGWTTSTGTRSSRTRAPSCPRPASRQPAWPRSRRRAASRSPPARRATEPGGCSGGTSASGGCWRTRQLLDWAREVKEMLRRKRPGALLGVYHCPWTDEEFGGARRRILGLDLEALAPTVDVFSPMVYHGRMQRRPEWVGEYVEWLSRRLGEAGEDLAYRAGARRAAAHHGARSSRRCCGWEQRQRPPA